jgi:8-oxo-dGTP pyrophosphatase MutT (NUDIX family)
MDKPRELARPCPMIGNSSRSPRTLANVILPVPVQRLGYRVAYAGLRLYWWVFRPRSSGVKCVLTHHEEVLLVRHTYGPRGWELPGGSRKRGEDAEVAATREIQEELGLSIDEWRSLGRIEVVLDHHRDSLYCFQAEVGSPELTLDLGELAAAEWFPKHALPRPLGRYTRAILDRIGAIT